MENKREEVTSLKEALGFGKIWKKDYENKFSAKGVNDCRKRLKEIITALKEYQMICQQRSMQTSVHKNSEDMLRKKKTKEFKSTILDIRKSQSENDNNMSNKLNNSHNGSSEEPLKPRRIIKFFRLC